MPKYTGSRIDHLNIIATDLTTSRAFYDAVLPVIGIDKLLDIPAASDQPAMVGYGRDPKPFLWLVNGDTTDPNLHLAFTVDTRADVDAFYAAALPAGATSRNEPTVHPEYHPDYYGAFVNDPDGTNLEADCHHPGDRGSSAAVGPDQPGRVRRGTDCADATRQTFGGPGARCGPRGRTGAL